ncbi:MAG: TatD family hydrolase [Deltaproteobacteria bacterium]|nr:TatD family hydrolase [Deltaproteobacteria bacterium]MBN2673721.1 TatD family hydrolase [Deltaproteobacteria bacterium]
MCEAHVPLFDSHCHLDMLTQRGLDIHLVIESAVAAGVGHQITIVDGGEHFSFLESVKRFESYESVFVGAGVHPHNASHVTETTLDFLAQSLQHPRVVAVGEIGLDYYYNHSTPVEQRKAFVSQLRLAKQLNLPVIIHTRDADDDTVSILQNEEVPSVGGVIHCFSAGEKLADAALGMGMYISFSGIVTFPKSTDVQQVAEWVPKDRLLSETDSPFLSPVPKRGRVNLPENVRYVVEKLADIRNADLAELSAQIVANTKRCFGIS